MATVLSNKLLWLYTFHSNSSTKLKQRTFIKSSNSNTQNRETTTPLQSKPTPISPKPLKISREPNPNPNQNANVDSSLWNSFSSLIRGISVDELGLEIASIALPAALALAADPITSLVDSAFVGHLGAVELAAVGVSVSVFNLVSKLFNVPLLNVTTSFVAEEQALICKDVADDDVSKGLGERPLPSASTSLALAAGVGIAEAVALSFGSRLLMNLMGIPVDSPMRIPAEKFLTWRAFGAPPIVLALAAQGVFRGFKDTKTPLYAITAGNLLNAIMSPILIFIFGFGIGGAALAAVISEYLIAFILLWELNTRFTLVSPNIEGGKVVRFLNSSGLLIGRTIAVLLTVTLSTSMAAREGPIQMAGHQICMQIWLAVSLLNDALALAGQALLAGGFSEGNYDQAHQVIYRVLQIGLATGVGLGVILWLVFGAFSSLFSTDSEVLEVARSGIWFVAGSQPMNAIAFVLDGLYYGVSDFGYAAYSMVIVGLLSSVFLVLAAPAYGLAGVWSGLFLFMTLRVVAGALRLGTKSGPWKLIWTEAKPKSE